MKLTQLLREKSAAKYRALHAVMQTSEEDEASRQFTILHNHKFYDLHTSP
jgi:hypothetical protein